MSKSCLYFAYGANMATKVLDKRNVKPHSWYPARVFEKNIELAFAHRGAYATLLEGDSKVDFGSMLRYSRPYGVLYELSMEDMEKLEKKEIGYQTRDIQVLAILDSSNGAGAPVLAKAFFSSFWMSLPTPVPPTHRYKDILVEGALEHCLHEEYVNWLKQLPSVDTKSLNDPSYSKTRSESLARIFALVTLFFFTRLFF